MRALVAVSLLCVVGLSIAKSRTPSAGAFGVVVTELKLDPGSVVGGSPSTGMVKLSAHAPEGGLAVTLSTDKTAAKVPSTVTVPAGSSSATFTITTGAVSAYTIASITAKLGDSSKDAFLPINPPGVKSVTFSAQTIKLGQTVTATVTLTGPAPAGNVPVKLTFAGNGTVQGQVFVNGGSTTATFPVSTGTGSDTGSIVVYAELNRETKAGVLHLSPTELSGIQLTPSSVIGGTTATVAGRINLDALAPKEGSSVELSTDNANAKCPSNIVVPSNSNYNTFTIQPLASATAVTAKITATYRGASKSATVTIQPATITSLTATPSTIKYGPTSYIRLEFKINGLAGHEGVRVPVTTSNHNVIPISGEPIVKYATDSVGTNFKVYYVKSQTVVTITASLNGVSKSVNITVNP